MSQSIIPVKIREHLIPFFYEEFKGVEAHYLNKRVKACKISMTSSIGKMLRITLEKSGYPLKEIDKIGKFNMYIAVSDSEASKTASAKIYKYVSGQYSFLKVPYQVAEDINDILEDQFRIAFVNRVKGALRFSPKTKVQDIISDFMVEYSLDEYGYKIASLQRLYNRSVAENKTMSRMQSKVSNRVLNYKG
ncbi:hypothetical protein [Lutibacter sp.]|uniref:hypothetical protein n=1 Tax=Lutibacter sp. TaxID=1925666 RepID=UPI00356644B9